MKSYSISDHCRFVKGSQGSAIYDLLNGTVYSITPIGTTYLLSALFGEIENNEAQELLDNLESLRLLNDHSCQIVEKRYHPQIRYVWLEITNRCNCKCLHCYGSFGSVDKYLETNELSLIEWKRIIDYLKDKGCNAVQLIGGEPLISPNFIPLLKYINEKGISRIDIFTNATLITDAIADIIQQCGASVRVSIYGHNAKTHDSITQRPGSFIQMETGLSLLKKRNVPISMAIVLMKENQSELGNIKSYLQSKGLDYNGFDTVRPVKHSIQGSHAVTDQTLIKARSLFYPHFRTSANRFSINHQWNSCWYGKFSITSQGDVIPCIFARDLHCGNVRTDKYNSIKEKLLSYWHISKDSVDECKECEFRYACDDCRPLAMGEGRGIYGKYPRCTYSPLTCVWDENS